MATQTKVPVRSGKIGAIEIARGVAALSVALHHADTTVAWGINYKAPAEITSLGLAALESVFHEALSFGFLGVQLFFVLSGFCIHLAHKNEVPLRARSFALRRFFRLYPVYLVICVLAFAGHLVTRDGFLGPQPLQNFIGHLFFWHYADGGANAGMGASPVFWTLTLEVSFYVIYLFLAGYIRKFGIGRFVVIWLIVDAVYHFCYSGSSASFFAAQRFPLTRFGEWLLGVMLAEDFAAGKGTRFDALAGAALLGLGFFLNSALSWDKYVSFDILGSMGFFFLLRSQLSSKGGMFEHSSLGEFFAWVGCISYSLYLIHPVVFSAFKALLRTVEAPYFRFGGFLVAIMAAICLAALSYRFFEEPFHRLGRRLAMRDAR
ncbi:acyltransferase family protein [Oleiharenicola sp. Vm1]|uniref:acyltransferase family protein n=1 Tax=Oleiharenicola sp. Vm1 TaxID=3398393 RepID=UPI0039F52E55